MRADLYRAFARLHFTPAEVDGMEVWQAAAILGVDEPADAETMDFGAAGRRPLTEADRLRLEKFDTAPVEGEDITGRVMRDMGIVPR